MRHENEPAAPQQTHVETYSTLVKLIARFRPVRAKALGTLALLLARTSVELAAPQFVTLAIVSLAPYFGAKGDLPPEFVKWIELLAAAMALRVLLQYVVAVATNAVAQDVENALRAELFAKVTHLRFSYHDENRSGRTIARSLRDMEKAKQFFREVAYGYVEAILLLGGVLAVSFWQHWSYGLAVAAFTVTPLVVTVRVGSRLARMDRTVSDQYDRVTTHLQENVAGARVVRAFGREDDESSRFGGSLGLFSRSWHGLAHFWVSVMPWVGNTYMCAIPFVLGIGAWRIAHGADALVEGATVLLILQYARGVSARLRPLTRLVIMGQEAVASAARVFEVLEHADVVAAPAAPAHLPATGGDVAFEDVSFGYPKRPRVLEGVSLRIPTGGSLGILGPTGAGKTTLVQLLPRFYDADRGRVLVDGIDVRELPVAELRAAVGLVFQEPFLFSATVADNIAYGKPGLARERIEACAKLAAAHEFVARLPKGYDTIVGERGVSLSGGQRQRLTIARALAMDPRVLVFDDATASVDAVTEKELFDGIRAAARGRTTIVISQRVTSLKWCDRVAVLEDGRVTAVGTHADLMAKSTLYREVQRHQELSGVHA